MQITTMQTVKVWSHEEAIVTRREVLPGFSKLCLAKEVVVVGLCSKVERKCKERSSEFYI